MFSNESANHRNAEDLERLQRYWHASGTEDLAVVFDLGTKATRILIGPKNVSLKEDDWISKHKKMFFNASRMFHLGDDIIADPILDISKNKALEHVIRFINLFLDFFRENPGRVRHEDIQAIGTAVFRWIENQETVLEYIHQRTGLKVLILAKKDEALLSLLSVSVTSKFRRRNIPIEHSGPQDVILLIDQGGGSAELSYFFPSNPDLFGLESLDQLGTVVLESNFYSLQNGEHLDPLTNKKSIRQQLGLLNQYIERSLEQWKGFQGVSGDEFRIFAFGMGTALSTATEDHNKCWTIDQIKNRCHSIATQLDTRYEDINQLHKQWSKRKKIREKLTVVCGISAYVKILEKLKISEIRFAGYGLRYGVYLARYSERWDLSRLPDRIKSQESPAYRERNEKKDRLQRLSLWQIQLTREITNTFSEMTSDLQNQEEYKKHINTLKQLHKINQKEIDFILNEVVSKTKRIFILASVRDKEYKKQLITWLDSARLPVKLDFESWDEDMQPVPAHAQRYLEKHIDEADLMICLLSTDFLNLESVKDNIISRALQRHAKGELIIIPVLVRKCLFERSPFFRFAPAHATPVNNWEDPDEAWFEISSRIIEQIEV